MPNAADDLDIAIDRRVFERFYLEVLGRLRKPRSQMIIQAICRDISAQGIGIITGCALKTGDTLELWLDIPDSHPSLHLVGSVVWLMESEPGIWRAGICFKEAQLTRLHCIFEGGDMICKER